VTAAEQIKSRLDIVDVVRHYVKLKRQGTGPHYVGLCPFHSEKTPSFKVHGERQSYKCFGCGAAGDVFTFVQQMENLTFPETLKLLAERHGVVVINTTLMPRRPNLTVGEYNSAKQFVAALVWYVEALLAEHKTRMWEAFEFGLPLRHDAPLFSESVRTLTSFLDQVRSWTPRQAAEAFVSFRRSQPTLTAELLADVEIFQNLVAEFVCAIAQREHKAA
jgi:hypothetical protein